MAYLRTADRFLDAMKSYMVAAARVRAAGGLVVDVGCGLGFDLDRLERAGLDGVGVDNSLKMLGEIGKSRGKRLVAADAAVLPFRSRSVDACRIERVLQHVEQPDAVVEEVARVVRKGGFVLAFEPDYTTFSVDSDIHSATFVSSLLLVRHPSIGGRLADLLERVGFQVQDIVTESSRGYHLGRLPVDVRSVLQRAVGDGRAAGASVDAWLDEQQAKTVAGTFRARWDKVMVVATRR